MGGKVVWNKKPKAEKDKGYLAWIHETQRCLVCKAGGIEVHHIRSYSIKGRDDRFVLPLCPAHHRGHFSPHGSPADFNERYPIEWQIKTAQNLYSEYQRG